MLPTVVEVADTVYDADWTVCCVRCRQTVWRVRSWRARKVFSACWTRRRRRRSVSTAHGLATRLRCPAAVVVRRTSCAAATDGRTATGATSYDRRARGVCSSKHDTSDPAKVRSTYARLYTPQLVDCLINVSPRKIFSSFHIIHLISTDLISCEMNWTADRTRCGWNEVGSLGWDQWPPGWPPTFHVQTSFEKCLL